MASAGHVAFLDQHGWHRTVCNLVVHVTLLLRTWATCEHCSAVVVIVVVVVVVLLPLHT